MTNYPKSYVKIGLTTYSNSTFDPVVVPKHEHMSAEIEHAMKSINKDKNVY